MAGSPKKFFVIVPGTFALTLAFGLANDQAIAAVAPQHFAIYQPDYFSFPEPWQQALCFTLVEAGGLGLAWGVLLYWAGSFGPGPQVAPRLILSGAAVVLLGTALLAWSLGWHASAESLPFPRFFYPAENEGLFTSQTVQITTLFVGPTAGLLWTFIVAGWRKFLKDGSPARAPG